jgi:hypothetical protein
VAVPRVRHSLDSGCCVCRRFSSLWSVLQRSCGPLLPRTSCLCRLLFSQRYCQTGMSLDGTCYQRRKNVPIVGTAFWKDASQLVTRRRRFSRTPPIRGFASDDTTNALTIDSAGRKGSGSGKEPRWSADRLLFLLLANADPGWMLNLPVMTSNVGVLHLQNRIVGLGGKLIIGVGSWGKDTDDVLCCCNLPGAACLGQTSLLRIRVSSHLLQP